MSQPTPASDAAAIDAPDAPLDPAIIALSDADKDTLFEVS